MTIPTVTLRGTNLTTTVLGFGCNALLGPNSRRQGLDMLAAAYDAGIRHFDVARAYSSGDAEGLLGEFLAENDRRSKVTITTKFGLQPPSGGVARLKFVKTIARKLMKLSPGLRKAIGAKSGKMVQQGAFSPEQARASLEKSLVELRTDRVEILLLHEATSADCTPELLSFLDECVREGRIGQYGVGSGFPKIEGVSHDRPDYSRILQFESSVVHRNRETLNPPSTTATITHGAIGRSFTELRAFFAKKPDVCRTWSGDLGLDLTAAATLAPLMLAWALRSNPTGIVLFSSTRPDAIRENVRAVIEGRFPADQLERFREITQKFRGT